MSSSNGDITVKYPSGKSEKVSSGITLAELAAQISPNFFNQLIAAKVDGKPVDLAYSLDRDAEVEFLKPDSEDGHEILLHSTAHLMAQAVKRLYPETQVTIGPAIENGFYYDFDREEPFTEEDLEAIEAEMQKIVDENIPVQREEISRNDAIDMFRSMGEQYKVEIISEIDEAETISAYRQGDFIDLCRGPHLPSTGKAGAFKLLSVAGAYWRGDERNKMLSRIYGTAFATKKALKKYLNMLEEAKRRDHRKLGKELDLFSFHDEAPANVFFHPKGTTVYNLIMETVADSNLRYGYQEVNTPLIMNVALWHQSGHYDNYRENMYFTKVDEKDFAVKPMNCPGHLLIFKSTPRSYRDLPVRMSEFGRVHRHERSGVTHGLFRVRTFVQDDAHIFCTEEDIQKEVGLVLDQIFEIYRTFGFENVHVELSTRPEKSIGSAEVWEKSEAALEAVLKDKAIDYKLNPGDGAFYGPKIDFHIRDSLGRSWQCGTAQLDFSMPERLGISYTGEDGQDHTPVMIHRAVVGSLERFMGILIEHYAASFPLWLAPIQVKLVPIADRHFDYTDQTAARLREAGIRVEVNRKNEKIGQKIRQAELEKVPVMLIIGDKEIENQQVSVRRHKQGDAGAISLDELLEQLMNEIREKAH
ncbi:MAG: threonine--tRNA ligase [Lentisphaeria bacterium]|nr:threonine--tRNA ligase [Candidatus Neomarinimicrobiota bacterium]MCF7842675.1 threonine--tRNA ligase [Lentisphaeria bacterium]